MVVCVEKTNDFFVIFYVCTFVLYIVHPFPAFDFEFVLFKNLSFYLYLLQSSNTIFMIGSYHLHNFRYISNKCSEKMQSYIKEITRLKAFSLERT